MPAYPDRCTRCPAWGWRRFLPKWVGRTCPACSGLWMCALAPDGRILAMRLFQRGPNGMILREEVVA